MVRSMDHTQRLQHITCGLLEARDILSRFLDQPEAQESIARAAASIADTLRKGGRVLSCGNGGSMCDAIHFAEELSGRFRKSRRALSAIVLSDPGHLTCVANDFGYDAVFSRGVEAHGRAGDVLLAISTSGRSPNILAAIRAALDIGMIAIALTGRTDSPAGAISGIDICAVADTGSTNPQPTERTQELHIKVIHLLVELVERELFPELYP